MTSITITLVGGPTALIEAGGFRFLTDPTFDPPGDYALPHVTLRKTTGPALPGPPRWPVAGLGDLSKARESSSRDAVAPEWRSGRLRSPAACRPGRPRAPSPRRISATPT